MMLRPSTIVETWAWCYGGVIVLLALSLWLKNRAADKDHRAFLNRISRDFAGLPIRFRVSGFQPPPPSPRLGHMSAAGGGRKASAGDAREIAGRV